MKYQLINKKVLKLTGINDLPPLLGQVKINIFGCPTIFNIIQKEVPVQEGVLGSEFFQDYNVNILIKKKKCKYKLYFKIVEN